MNGLKCVKKERMTKAEREEQRKSLYQHSQEVKARFIVIGGSIRSGKTELCKAVIREQLKGLK